MIYLYSGTPGAGKSLHQASDIYWWLHNGKPCICNFDINLEAIKCKPQKLGEFYYIDNQMLRPELLIKYSKIYFKNHKFKEGAIRLYIDECQLLFNAREWNTAGRKEWLSFFTQHRKYGYDIFLVAQFAEVFYLAMYHFIFDERPNLTVNHTVKLCDQKYIISIFSMLCKKR